MLSSGAKMPDKDFSSMTHTTSKTADIQIIQRARLPATSAILFCGVDKVGRSLTARNRLSATKNGHMNSRHLFRAILSGTPIHAGDFYSVEGRWAATRGAGVCNDRCVRLDQTGPAHTMAEYFISIMNNLHKFRRNRLLPGGLAADAMFKTDVQSNERVTSTTEDDCEDLPRRVCWTTFLDVPTTAAVMRARVSRYIYGLIISS